MLIACNAWEGMYQGLHGIESLEVLEVKDLEDAKEQLDNWGNIESEELIYSFGLEEEYLDEDEEEMDISETIHFLDRGWRGAIIKEGFFPSEIEADEKLATLGWDLFVEEYCENEIL